MIPFQAKFKQKNIVQHCSKHICYIMLQRHLANNQNIHICYNFCLGITHHRFIKFLRMQIIFLYCKTLFIILQFTTYSNKYPIFKVGEANNSIQFSIYLFHYQTRLKLQYRVSVNKRSWIFYFTKSIILCLEYFHFRDIFIDILNGLYQLFRCFEKKLKIL